MEDWGKDGIQKVETWERHKQRMKCQIFYDMYFIIVCSFLSYIEKESKVSTKGRKNTQVQSQAFPIFHSKLGLHLTLIYLFLVSSKIV
jgi:hypothetical protein